MLPTSPLLTYVGSSFFSIAVVYCQFMVYWALSSLHCPFMCYGTGAALSADVLHL